MKNVGNSSDGRSQGVPKISGHPCTGRMGALRGHLCDSTAFLLLLLVLSFALYAGICVTSCVAVKRIKSLSEYLCRKLDIFSIT